MALLAKIPLLYKVYSLGKSDRRSDVTGFGSNMVVNKQGVHGAYDTSSVSVHGVTQCSSLAFHSSPTADVSRVTTT